MDNSVPRMAKKLVVDQVPNRLFMQYLAEWRDEASAKGDKSSYTYNKAYKTLKKYPLPLQCGSEAKILENFGDKICKLLDERLARDSEAKEMTPSEFLEKSRKVPESWWKKINTDAPVAVKKPAKRKKKASAQGDNQTKRKMTNPTIEKHFLDSKPVMKQILQHVPLDPSPPQNGTLPDSAPDYILRPGEFDVVLCVDTRETMGESRRKEIAVELAKQIVCYEQRTLHIGDFLWVAQEKPANCTGRPARELVLDYIVERKILSDLSMSIRDGRFHEQKIRLKQSGLENIIYLIENIGDIENQSLPEQTLRQASYNTQIVDNICVKYTRNTKATVRYLNTMTKRLQRLYGTCTLEAWSRDDVQHSVDSNTHRLTTFTKFNEMGSKHRKLAVNEMFTKQLMQIHGISFDKASAITSIYRTPMHLVQTYRGLITEKEREELLSNIKFGLTQRNLGVAISKVICKVFTT